MRNAFQLKDTDYSIKSDLPRHLNDIRSSMLKPCRGSSSRRTPAPHLRDQPYAKDSGSDHGSLQRPRPGATTIADFAASLLNGASGSCVRNISRTDRPSGGPFHGRCRSLARATGILHSSMTAEIEHTSSPRAG